MRIHLKKTAFWLLLSVSMILYSCVSQKNLEYLQDSNTTIREFKEADVSDYKLRPNDELYIQISSQDEAAANVFSATMSQSTMGIGGMQPYGASLAAYSIDRNGYLLLPLIGNLMVKDKTTSQVSSMLTDSLKSVLNQPNVVVKLVNRYVTVLGEVRIPGHVPYAQEKFTIFEALGLAGDFSPLANRNEVILVRNEEGKNIRVTLNLSKSDILASEYYYLRPNDLVYVKPLKKKMMRMRDPLTNNLLSSISLVFSLVSTALLIYTVVKK
ncbi:MAG: polysaccharide export protein [Bacteroidetes bacterium]|nr:polysaccharide export protein [Bacteroidota bacterium]